MCQPSMYGLPGSRTCQASRTNCAKERQRVRASSMSWTLRTARLRSIRARSNSPPAPDKTFELVKLLSIEIVHPVLHFARQLCACFGFLCGLRCILGCEVGRDGAREHEAFLERERRPMLHRRNLAGLFVCLGDDPVAIPQVMLGRLPAHEAQDHVDRVLALYF